jgi:hypothetical protein
VRDALFAATVRALCRPGPVRSTWPVRLVSSEVARRLVGEVAEQHVRVRECRGEDLFGDGEELCDARVPDAVLDAGARAAALENAVLAQRGQVLRGAA